MSKQERALLLFAIAVVVIFLIWLWGGQPAAPETPVQQMLRALRGIPEKKQMNPGSGPADPDGPIRTPCGMGGGMRPC